MIRTVIYLVLLLQVTTPVLAQEDWKEAKYQHFLIYYHEAPMDFVDNVAKSAEEEYYEIAKNMGFTRYEGWSWDRRAKIYIYDDQEHYVEAKNISWSHGAASPQDKVIRTFPTAAGFFDSTLPHELGHIIFREFVGYKSRIPLWLEEGVAMYQEKAKRWGANKIVQQAMSDGKFLPLNELTYEHLSCKADQELIELFYAESASVVYYMMTELGEFRFVTFCRHLQNGLRFEDALNRAFVRFKTVDDLNTAWKAYLSQ